MPALKIGFGPFLSYEWSVAKFRGVARYVQAHPDLELTLFQQLSLEPPAALDEIDGFVGSFFQEDVDLLHRLGKPVVGLEEMPFSDLPRVALDTAHIAEEIAAHWLQAGVRDVAFFGSDEPAAFIQRQLFDALEAGFSGFADLNQLGRIPIGPGVEQEGWSLTAQLGDLQEWLLGQIRPIGVIAGDALHGWRLLRACKLAGLSVPEDVAIIAFTNDATLSTFCRPSLTTQPLDLESIGYEGTMRLHEWLTTGQRPADQALLPPRPLVVRASSQPFRQTDARLEEAIGLLRQQVTRGMDLNAIAEEIAVSRRQLYRLFREKLGVPPGEVFRRIKRDRALKLLEQTDWPLTEVALDAGYADASQFSQDIKTHTGLTPGQFRRRYRSVKQ